METKHTKGNWRIGYKNKFSVICDTPNGTKKTIAIAEMHLKTQDEAETNAKLIAAAPELLEALKEAYEHIDSYFFPELKEKCLKAINKATLTNLKMS